MARSKPIEIGQKYGRLTVVEQVGKAKNGTYVFRCVCDCGGEKDVHSSALRNNLTRSCGCLYKESRKTCNSAHGMAGTTTHNSWLGMKQRCYYEKHDYYPSYGGRGIRVSERWLNSFQNFFEDMGEKPEGYSLDRVDVDGDYTPENCVWSTQQEQSRNTRKHKENSAGVGLHKATKKWYASICVDGKSVWLGLFLKEEDARKARWEAEYKYWRRNV